MTRVGVLALQGDVPEHAKALATLLPPDDVRLVRTLEESERTARLQPRPRYLSGRLMPGRSLCLRIERSCAVRSQA